MNASLLPPVPETLGREIAPLSWTPPPFLVRAPWWNGDLQTCRNFVLRRLRGNIGVDLAPFPDTRLTLPLADGTGDRLAAVLNRPLAAQPGAPLAVLVHGLSGSEASVYMMLTAYGLLCRGHAVLRLNLRGAGRSRRLCSREYHAGASSDLRDALAGLDPALLADGVVLVGYSLGGNIVLKLAGEGDLPATVRAAVSVSAPIDLAEADRRMHARRNRFYHDQLLFRLKRHALRPGADVTPAECQAVRASRTIREFNDVFIAPRNGYGSAAEYYERAAALPLLPRIEVPTLAIHAEDDPWIPVDAYRRVRWDANPRLHPQILRKGGHVGFHVRGDGLPWHDRAMAAFFDAVLD